MFYYLISIGISVVIFYFVYIMGFVTASKCCAFSKYEYTVCVEVETDLLELIDLVNYVRKYTTYMSSFSILTQFVPCLLIFTFQTTRKEVLL